jgi:microsomal dipeptidase-like Zn-dependent dipeptidase
MLEGGLPEDSVRKILGANALRVLRQTLPPR